MLVHSPLLFCPVQVHILSPDLSPKMVHNSIRDDATNAPITFEDLDGQLLRFATEARPAKQAFAWHAEGALRIGKALGWPAASRHTVPRVAWSSETCDSAIRERYFHDQQSNVAMTAVLKQMWLLPESDPIKDSWDDCNT